MGFYHLEIFHIQFVHLSNMASCFSYPLLIDSNIFQQKFDGNHDLAYALRNLTFLYRDKVILQVRISETRGLLEQK